MRTPTREFLVEIVTTIPPGTDPAIAGRRRADEAARISELAAQGHVMRLWRAAGRTVGLLRATDEARLRAVLDTLPLRPWMRLDVTALAPHPNDPLGRQP